MEDITITQDMQPGKITANFEEVKASIIERLAEFDGAQFTEESRTLCKNLRAELRKEKAEITDTVKRTKKEWLAPFEAFEAKAKELTGLYDEKIDYLDAQDKEMEAARVARKREKVAAIYSETFKEELKAEYSLERIYNPKWDNATFKEADIRAEIAERSAQIHDDLQTILAMNSTAADKAIEIYKRDFKLGDALAYIHDIEAQIAIRKELEEEQRRHEEIARIREEERQKILAEQKAQEEKAAAVEEAKREAIEALIPDDVEEETGAHIYSITLTPSAKEALETYMNSIGIEWEELA